MNTRAFAAAVAAVAPLVLVGGSAHATLWQFDWADNAPAVGHSDDGGAWSSVHGSYDDAAGVLSWSVTFADQVTEGLTLALSNGADPKGHAGRLGLLYIDVTNHAAPIVTAYAFNGANTYLSYADGDGSTDGHQTPDRIASSLTDTGFLISAGMLDGDGHRTISFSIDAGAIQSHVPLYPHVSDPWEGVAFGGAMGVWMHAFKDLTTAYGDSGADAGYLTNWYRGGGDEGYFEGSDLRAVPAPGAGAIAMVGTAGLAGRRRTRCA